MSIMKNKIMVETDFVGDVTGRIYMNPEISLEMGQNWRRASEGWLHWHAYNIWTQLSVHVRFHHFKNGTVTNTFGEHCHR